MNDEQKNAQAEYDRAVKKVQAQPTVAQGGKRTEDEFGEAYQRLVKAGLAPQLKRKYRPLAGV